MTYAEVSTLIRYYVRKWELDGGGVKMVDEAYELMDIEQFYKLCHHHLKSNKNPRNFSVAVKLADQYVDSHPGFHRKSNRHGMRSEAKDWA